MMQFKTSRGQKQDNFAPAGLRYSVGAYHPPAVSRRLFIFNYFVVGCLNHNEAAPRPCNLEMLASERKHLLCSWLFKP